MSNINLEDYQECDDLTKAARAIFGPFLKKVLCLKEKVHYVSADICKSSNLPYLNVDYGASIILCFNSGRMVQFKSSEWGYIELVTTNKENGNGGS